jgi:hypothetical protein
MVGRDRSHAFSQMSADAESGRDLRSDPELADLLRTLRGRGVLTRKELFERSGARHWRDQSFRAALRRGVAEGIIKELDADLFELGDDAPDLNEGRFGPT